MQKFAKIINFFKTLIVFYFLTSHKIMLISTEKSLLFLIVSIYFKSQKYDLINKYFNCRFAKLINLIS